MHDILSDLEKKLASATTEAEAKAVEREFLGPESTLKKALRDLKGLTPQERTVRGPELQKILTETQTAVSEKLISLDSKKLETQLKKEVETLEPDMPRVGHLHPITQAVTHINNLFTRMGYSIYESPEIETDEFNFERLNVPKDHPAREMQDTIYIEAPEILLRTQTSSIEARALAELKPPFRIVCPGQVYRNEKANKSNHFIFHQYQGVVVQERVSLKDLFGTFTLLFKELYGENVVVRFRSKYYPEVEPGVGLDMQCFSCNGSGCTVCKGIGWIEMGGSGIIHEKVLTAAGINPKKWMGFAFGLGLDRWVMAKYNISDIRTLLGGNLAYKYHEGERIF